MNFIGREIGHFFVGIMFLTRLPVPSGLRHVDGRLARSARYFPLVGVLIGVLAAGAFWATSTLMPASIAAMLTLAVTLMITGALHEDGLADCCDGIGGGASREHTLEIMRDSRIGTYGAAGLILSLGLRWAAIASFTAAEGLLGLIIAHSLSRAMIPPVLVSAKYARTRGLASSVAEGVSSWEAAFAVMLAVGVALIGGPVAGIAALAAASLGAAVTLMILVRRLGGYTGDGLGAIQQVAEIAVLITLASIWA
jgi:adenosylcobinamide-GDP ribazoletransferase